MKTKLFYIIILALYFAACNKVDKKPVTIDLENKIGLLVLNEGLFQQNNSSLSWIDLIEEKIENDVFKSINNRPLGDTGNDMIKYGQKIYIAINNSSTLEVIDQKTLKSLKHIQLNYQGKSQQPRQLTTANGKVYISSFDGYVNILDTTSLSILDRIKVGKNPEGIAVNDDFLFVANSGGLNFPNYDSTVYKIDLTTNQVVDSFIVGSNPGNIITIENKGLYVSVRGDYANNPTTLKYIDLENNIINDLQISATSFLKYDNKLYLGYYDHNSNMSAIKEMNISSQIVVNENIIENIQINTLYGMAIREHQLFLSDANHYTNQGKILVFNLNTLNIDQVFDVGLNPSKSILIQH